MDDAIANQQDDWEVLPKETKDSGRGNGSESEEDVTDSEYDQMEDEAEENSEHEVEKKKTREWHESYQENLDVDMWLVLLHSVLLLFVCFIIQFSLEGKYASSAKNAASNMLESARVHSSEPAQQQGNPTVTIHSPESTTYQCKLEKHVYGTSNHFEALHEVVLPWASLAGNWTGYSYEFSLRIFKSGSPTFSSYNLPKEEWLAPRILKFRSKTSAYAEKKRKPYYMTFGMTTDAPIGPLDKYVILPYDLKCDYEKLIQAKMYDVIYVEQNGWDF